MSTIDPQSSSRPDDRAADENIPPEQSDGLLSGLDPALLAVIGLGLLGLLMMCVFGVLLFDPWGWTSNEATAGDATATPAALAATATPGPVEAVKVVANGAETLSINLDPPTAVIIGGRRFPVTVQFADESGFVPQPETDNTAVWLYGSVVNYVFGVAPTAENQQILESLVTGDPIIVSTQDGDEKQFVFVGRELLGDPDRPLYAQTRPGLTVVQAPVEGGDAAGAQLLLQADYVLPSDENNPTGDAPLDVEIGESAQAGDIRVTVNNTTQVVDSPNAPPGFALYLVDYQIENMGASRLDTGLLRFVLTDELGNQYSLNALAGQAGNNRTLSGFLESGAQQTVTAGYQIPLNLTGSSLRWVVSRVDNPSQISVSIPFGGGAIDRAAVDLQQAEVSSDGTSLLVSGQISNAGSQPLVVSESNISLSSNGTVYLVFSTSPGFPWTVAPGGAIPFSLTFQRPSTPTAVLQIGTQSFELTGLR